MKKLFTLLTILSFFTAAEAQFTSQNINLLSNWDDPAVPAEAVYGIRYSGIWGWYDNSNSHEYAIIGSSDGYYFIDVTNPTAPVNCDFVAGVRDSCIWREIKTYSHYAYLISDDNNPNSFQIVDLQYLPDSVHVVYNSNTLFSRAHTLYVDGDKLYCASVKGGPLGHSSMAVYSLANPELPVLISNLDSTLQLPGGNVHDMYVRNDTVYASAGYDGLFIFLYDGLNDSLIYINSLTTYPSQGYNHSSALTEDGRTLIFTDEVPNGLPVKAMDVSDLSNLSVNTTFFSNIGATPHNPFIVGNICYMAYYQDGLYVYDVSNVNNPVQLGFFDSFNNPGGTYLSPAYKGGWGAYPFLPSGNILLSDMQTGLYVLDASAVQSVKETDKNSAFTIFPNPASSSSTLNYNFPSRSGAGTFILSDNAGRIIEVYQNIPQSAGQLQLPATDNGMYTLTYTSESGESYCRKLVVSSK